MIWDKLNNYPPHTSYYQNHVLIITSESPPPHYMLGLYTTQIISSSLHTICYSELLEESNSN